MPSRETAAGHGQLSQVPTPVVGRARLPTCTEHPGSLVRTYRSHGPHGPGVYPQCVPTTGEPPHLLAWTAETVPEHVSESNSAALSASERAVLDDAALGLTVGETARKRSKSSETIKSQRRSILLKLGARNMPHAIAVVMHEEALGTSRVA
jgi:DNA-binding CsgD family transcriptional regulator